MFQSALLVGGMALLMGQHVRAVDNAAPMSWSFAELSRNNTVGVIVLVLQYGTDGRIRDAGIIRSNAPYEMENGLVYYVERNWKTELFAGRTMTVPVVFEQSPTGDAHWNEDMEKPFDPLHVGDATRKLKIRVVFDSDGWVKDVKTIEPSGVDSLDRQTEMWIKVHWHHDAFAGQTVEVPFRFEAPVPAPPPPAPVKKAVKHDKKPAPPAEPVAIPAIRAE